MPQPFRGDSCRGGPNLVLERPELAAHIGNVVANWVLLEGDLTDFYAFLMGTYLPNEAGWAPPTHPVASQVFAVVQSFNARLKLVDELCQWRGGKEEAEAFSELVPRIRHVAGARATVAHAQWMISDRHPRALILRRRPPQVWVKRDFENVSRRILETRASLNRIIQSFYERHDRMRECL